jgi:hypothetical protein
VRFEVPDADDVHVLGVEEVGGGANLSDFVLLGKILPFYNTSLIIINYSHDLSFFS